MSIIRDLAEHIGVDVLSGFGMSRETRREKGKWGALFALFALMAMLAFFIQHNSMKGADLLGGRATIERFMRSNVIAMVILLLSAVGFILLCFNTWKGRRGSIYQLVYTVAAGIVIILSGVSIFRSIHNIQKDLDSPKTVTVEEYVLCTNGNTCYLAFDQEGTIDSVLLVVPADKYNELKKGVTSTKGYLSRTWRLIDESEYVKYSDVQFYDTPIEVTYYAHSIIYEDCGFKQTAAGAGTQ